MEMLRSLLSVTAYSAVLLAAILLVRRFLSARLSPALQYALWFLLIARLLLPVSVESPLRLITLPERQAPVSAALPASVPAASPVVPEASGAVLPTPMPAAPAVIARPAANGLSAVSIHQIVYFSGAARCGGSFAVLYALLRRRIRKFGARPAQGLVQLTEETRRALGIRARIRPVCLDEPGSPALLFPATLLLPADLLAIHGPPAGWRFHCASVS